MKKLTYIFLFFLISACEVIIVEPYDPRERIVGRYQVEEYSETYDEFFLFDIRISSLTNDGETIRIHNFYDVGISVTAYFYEDYIEIPFQVIGDYEVSGHGDFVDGEIVFSYRVYDRYYGGYADYCYATAW